MHVLTLIYSSPQPLTKLYQITEDVAMHTAGYFEQVWQEGCYGVGTYKAVNLRSVNCFINDLKRVLKLNVESVNGNSTKFLLIKGEKTNGKNHKNV